jgi:iron complex outermembrane receptor protein
MYGQSVKSDSELIKARSLVGFNVMYLSYERDWQLEAYGENIFNEVYDQGRLNNLFHGFVGVVLSNDRSEFGLRFTKRFDVSN